MLDTNEEIRSGKHIVHDDKDDDSCADSSSKLHQNVKPLTVEVRSLCVATVKKGQTSQKMLCL